MNNKQELHVLRSIRSAWCGKRNIGNMSSDELDIAEELELHRLIKESTYKGSKWYELTEMGQERLYKLNGLRLGV